MLPGYPLVLASASADGPTLTTSTAATSIMPTTAIATIPANALQIGSTLKVLMRGRISNIVTSPGTITFDLRIGGVVVSALGAVTLNATAQTNAAFELEFLATIRSVGSAAAASALVTARYVSRAHVGGVAVASGGDQITILPDTAPAVGTGFDSTVATSVNVFATFSVSNAGNNITVHQALVELKV